MKNNVAIIGYGYVGKGMGKIFPDAYIYDPFALEQFKKDFESVIGDLGLEELREMSGVKFSTKEEINEECGLAIVCVPTPPKGMTQEDSGDAEEITEVDLSIIEETIEWLETPLVLIKSTVPPGTTNDLDDKYINKFLKKDNNSIKGVGVCFSPEYLGEGKYYVPERYPDPEDPRKHHFMIIGGEKESCEDILQFFVMKLGPAKKYMMMDAVEAELVKYMENTWGATKVTFFNEWYDICQELGASFSVCREGMLLDSRVEEMHTAVFKSKRGFGGKCYPKDLMGIIALMESKGYTPELLKAVWTTNKKLKKKSS